MDISQVADTLTKFLAPALPYLMGLGGKAAEEATKELEADIWAKAKSLWGRLRPKVETTQPAALETAQDVVAKPGDEGARAALTYQLRKVLESDPDLAREVEGLLDPTEARNVYQAWLEGSGAIAQGPGAVAVGERGIAVGGDVHGGNLGTGDRKRGEE